MGQRTKSHNSDLVPKLQEGFNRIQEIAQEMTQRIASYTAQDQEEDGSAQP